MPARLRRDGVVANRSVYLAIGIDCDGAKQRPT
jgi:transposase-like protein